MNKHQFFKNFFYVVLYGIVATILYFMIVAGLTYLLRELGTLSSHDLTTTDLIHADCDIS